MNGPVYTEQAACQDCYRCLRHCPVKAIRVRDGKAEVVRQLCLNCGRCLAECPVHAKKIRSDGARVRQMLALGRRVFVSLAPSWIAEFSEADDVIRRISALGFHGVEETALGAERLARACAADPDAARGISSACPVVVEYVTRYRPELIGLLSPLISPAEAHARLMKKHHGDDIAVVFIGPCVAKKLEADNPEGSIDAALTFRELRDWIDGVVPGEAGEGIPGKPGHRCADFFLEGGFLGALSRQGGSAAMKGYSLSGLESVLPGLDGLAGSDRRDLPPLELLACAGGCHNGPGVDPDRTALERRMRAAAGLESGRAGTVAEVDMMADILLTREYAAVSPGPEGPDPAKIREVLAGFGRPEPEDDMDCGSCGYRTCMQFAAAVLAGMAEEMMCVSRMRRLAQDRGDALMKALPLGAVIIDSDMNITECNRNFLRLFSELDFDPPEKALRGIQGRSLGLYLTELEPFRQVLSGRTPLFSGTFSSGGRIIRSTVFPVGEGNLVGAMFQDITSPQVEREMVVRKAEEVIQKNLASVQQIASLLGENAAETQLILDSLIGAVNE